MLPEAPALATQWRCGYTLGAGDLAAGCRLKVTSGFLAKHVLMATVFVHKTFSPTLPFNINILIFKRMGEFIKQRFC